VNSRIKTCFITAPSGSNLELLIKALRQRNIDVVSPHQWTPGGEIGIETTDLISNVDLVIGVLTRERRSEWILFELGQAWGLGKRILLFAPPNSVHLPSTLRRFLTVRVSLSNQEAIEFALDQLLAAPEPTSRFTSPAKESRPLGPSAENYLHGLASVKYAELELLITKALKEAGVDVLATSSNSDIGVDLAIWSEPLQPFVGNPLLVEIKTRLPTSKAAAAAAQQLAKHVTAAGGLWGLLLYAIGPDEPKSLPPNVLALPVEELFRRLRRESFDDIVRDLRNRRVHGLES
jgi:hypothetical protein